MMIGDEWKTVTADQYDEYHFSQDYAGVALLSSCPQVSSHTVAPAASTAPRARVLVFEFKRGIKCDSRSFLVYKEKKQWDTWQRSTLVQA
jgi:hypothetical protein